MCLSILVCDASENAYISYIIYAAVVYIRMTDTVERVYRCLVSSKTDSEVFPIKVEVHYSQTEIACVELIFLLSCLDSV